MQPHEKRRHDEAVDKARKTCDDVLAELEATFVEAFKTHEPVLGTKNVCTAIIAAYTQALAHALMTESTLTGRCAHDSFLDSIMMVNVLMKSHGATMEGGAMYNMIMERQKHSEDPNEDPPLFFPGNDSIN